MIEKNIVNDNKKDFFFGRGYKSAPTETIVEINLIGLYNRYAALNDYLPLYEKSKLKYYSL